MIHRPRKDKGELSGDRATRQPSRYSRQSKKSGRRSSTASARSSFQPLTGEGKGRDSQSGLKILPVDRTRSVLMKRRGKTDPAYGTSPRERGLEMHLRLGAINLDKTSGPTSHEIVAWVKRILEVDKAGHSGTLDPKVTGILPVLLGDATRVMETLLMAGKEYICLMHVHKPVPKRRIIEVCGQFVGPILQKPPLKSSVVKELRTRTIYYLEVLEIEEQHVLMRVGCQAGTYIRKLCYDMGLALGTGANMEELRRTRAGPFREDDTLATLHQLMDAYMAYKERGDESLLRRVIQPVEAALAHLPRLEIADNAVDAICHGAPLAAPGLLSLETGISRGDDVVLFTLKGEAVAIARAELSSEEMLASSSGIVAATERVIMEPGTYPKAWKLAERDGSTEIRAEAKR
ncbi:MAG: RNA-guided pseudouridylation complex pseudouridine synthase subunit Cbf5 [Methanothrix sp.]|jgi:H/ACA ribonucleoprotein complex subunit 4|uniref:RNA-guided pseudouridylation complex pseudouridine synthase subunit Cbf5 n=1 Tax=Methanothrix sp. TaxID=90426 RepID=UPI0025FF7102|nr:RNA-guided pseudouridylation complex pseudouridine synthase subunit Cbf5 [Methanothrix sp.]MBK7385642.1 RNA-guided pseudouridylation complex pseudouridine synthase subunit Cbf5 [Methanothrix sp.]HPW74299.1 RNA-guided pseudouridylation complex pseudouridine synthase subunit Cbf5 [Methanothrix sp.]